MAQFTDMNGHVWSIELTDSIRSEIEQATGITEAGFLGGTLIYSLGENMGPAVEAAWIACKNRAADLGYTERGFYRVIGENVTDAVAALAQSYADSVQEPIGREFVSVTAEVLRTGSTASLLAFVQRQVDLANAIISTMSTQHG